MMNFISQRDKQMHILVCFSLALSCVIFLSFFSFANITIFIVAYSYSMCLGVGKEVWDMIREGGTGFSKGDVVADFFGAILGAAMVFVGGYANG